VSFSGIGEGREEKFQVDETDEEGKRKSRRNGKIGSGKGRKTLYYFIAERGREKKRGSTSPGDTGRPEKERGKDLYSLFESLSSGREGVKKREPQSRLPLLPD